MKVYELARDLGVKAGVILTAAKKIGLPQDNHMDSVDEAQESALRSALKPAPTGLPEKKGPGKPHGAQPAGECQEVDETLPEVNLPPGHVAGPDGLEVPEGSEIAQPSRMVDVNYQGKVRSVRV